ncbi:hypothetical protein LPTSP4_35260 [Leptospira ryugenii]|uniref:Outer membrane protein n=1 Tax=Leptospira ryugenii TaxID=1917863 RepID=A0A2P2E542_9LEPT|nr:hypothetical protein [Leptospira ryugenii]GBF51988.1 hypothetical protein LPTSP4_35260 [Leptospira ryugenii]
MNKQYKWLLSAVLYLSMQGALSAQFTCEGTACGFLPRDITSSLNSSYLRLQTDYLNEVLKTNTEAGFLANLGSNNIGTGTVRRLQVGASVSAAGYKKDDIIIEEPGFKLPKLPNVGGSVVPNVNIDFNPGWILGFDSRHWTRRFAIFLHGMDAVVPNKQLQGASNNKNYEGRITIKNYGGMIRFQVIEKYGFLGNVITWDGFNIGAGHHVMEQDFDFKYLEGKAATIESNGVKAKWGGDTVFNYNTKVRTTNVDIRTGVGVFWVINVILGGGYSWNTGDSDLSVSRRGPLVVQTSAISAIEIPREYQSQIDPAILQSGPSGTLGLTLGGSSQSKKNLAYGIAGLEFDIYLLKIIVEGIYGGKDLYSANLGVRASF